MARNKALLLLMFLFLNQSRAELSVIYSAYLRSEIRGTLSEISEQAFYSTPGKQIFGS